MTAGKLPGVSGPRSLTCSSRVKQGRGRPRVGQRCGASSRQCKCLLQARSLVGVTQTRGYWLRDEISDAWFLTRGLRTQQGASKYSRSPLERYV